MRASVTPNVIECASTVDAALTTMESSEPIRIYERTHQKHATERRQRTRKFRSAPVSRGLTGQHQEPTIDGIEMKSDTAVATKDDRDDIETRKKKRAVRAVWRGS